MPAAWYGSSRRPGLYSGSARQLGRGPIHEFADGLFLRGSHSVWHYQGIPEEDTPALDRLPTIQRFLHEVIPGKIGKALLVNLKPGRVIPRHRYKRDYFATAYRFHVAIVTSEHVHFNCGQRFYNMKAGEVWVIDNLGKHAVINDGTEDRLHLIFDVFVDDRTTEVVRNADYSLGFEDTRLLSKAAGSPAQRLAKRMRQIEKSSHVRLR